MTGRPSPLALVRRFHVSPDGGELSSDVLPSALEPFRDASRVSFTWPLVLTDDPAHPPFVAVADALATAAPPSAQVLRDNLARVERMVRAHGVGRLVREVLDEVRPALQAHLGLHEGPAAQLDAAWAELTAAMAGDARLVGYSRDALQALVEGVLRRTHRGRRAALREKCDALHAELQVLLPRTSADELAAEVGQAGRFLDPAALAKIVGTTRREVGPERRARIERICAVLAAPLDLPVVCFEADIGEAVARFDAMSSQVCAVIGALHAARLELEGGYDPARHDAVLEAMDWQGLTVEELGLLPTVIAIVPGADLAGDLGSLSSVLLSGRPLHVIAEVDPAADPAGASGWRLELAYFGLALRQVWVQQSCLSRPAHLAEGLQQSLRSLRSALHVVAVPPRGTSVAPWLVAGAAIEGRGHPLFRYDPSAAAFADRVDFSGNPAPELDWPLDAQKRPFTFAHFALLHDELRSHFKVVAPGLEDEDLVPVEAWLGLAAAEAAAKVPVIDAVDGEGTPCTLAVSRQLGYAARDRLGFWRSLQELAGIHNAWAERAAAGALERAKIEGEARLAEVRQAHAGELDQVRRTAADEAMRRLTDVLLGGALLAPAPAPQAARATSRPPADNGAGFAEAEPPAEQAAAPEPEAEAGGFDDPYIDTVLCTSCNECVNLNPKLFVYDANKQASIGDPDAGTYEQLAMAAEVCPARCIHPGKPRNPSEPNLDALIAKVAELGV